METTNLCRLCLGFESLLDIFEITSSETELNKIIHTVTGVKITREDFISRSICSICHKVIQHMYKYRCTAIKNDKLLREKYKNIKQEPEEINLHPVSSQTHLEENPEKNSSSEHRKRKRSKGIEIFSSDENSILYKCSKCNLSYVDMDDFLKHKKIHLKCIHCQKQCRSKTQLNHHLESCSHFSAVKMAQTLKVELNRLSLENIDNIKRGLKNNFTESDYELEMVDLEDIDFETDKGEIEENESFSHLQNIEARRNQLLLIKNTSTEPRGTEESDCEIVEIENSDDGTKISAFNETELNRSKNKSASTQTELKYSLCFSLKPLHCTFLNWIDVLRLYNIPVNLQYGEFSINISSAVKKKQRIFNLWECDVQQVDLDHSSFKVERPKFAEAKPRKSYCIRSETKESIKFVNQKFIIKEIPLSLINMNLKKLIQPRKKPETNISNEVITIQDDSGNINDFVQKSKSSDKEQPLGVENSNQKKLCSKYKIIKVKSKKELRSPNRSINTKQFRKKPSTASETSTVQHTFINFVGPSQISTPISTTPIILNNFYNPGISNFSNLNMLCELPMVPIIGSSQIMNNVSSYNRTYLRAPQVKASTSKTYPLIAPKPDCKTAEENTVKTANS